MARRSCKILKTLILRYNSSVVALGLPAAQPLVTALTMLLTSVLSALVLPFTAAVTALTYIDLRMRGEGLDVELRRAAGV